MKKLLVSLMSILQLLSFAVVPCAAVPPPPGGNPSNARTIYLYESSSESDTDNNNVNEDSSHREKPLTWYAKLKLKADLGDPKAIQKLAERKAKQKDSYKKRRDRFKAQIASGNPKAKQKLEERRAKQKKYNKRETSFF